MFVSFLVSCNARDTDGQVLDGLEQYLSGQSAVGYYRPKPNYAFIVVDVDIAQETLLLQHGVIRADKQPREFEVSAFQRRSQQRILPPIRSQPQLTVLVVHGQCLSAVHDNAILGWFRNYGPLVNITREPLDTAFITMLQKNAYALLEESRRCNATWPSELRLELNSEARPADPSVRIDGNKVCCAYLRGHCCHDSFLCCPFALSHPLHESGIDYDDVLLRHSRKRKAIESTGDEDCDTAGEFHANTFPIMPLPCKLNLLLCFHFCK